jgi:hypothetical protein
MSKSKKRVEAPSEALLKHLDYDIKILDNMEKRVRTYTTKLSHCSYIDRILLRIDYTRRALKEFKQKLLMPSVSEMEDTESAIEKASNNSRRR